MADAAADRGFPDDDEDIQRLYAALSWEAGGRGLRPGTKISLTLHVAILMTYVIGVTPPDSGKKATKAHMPGYIAIYTPQPSSGPPPPPAKPETTSMAGTTVSQPKLAEDGPSRVKVDFLHIDLGFVKDTNNQLAAVVQREGGQLAFLNRTDSKYAEFVFEPPDWRMLAGPKNIIGSYQITMDPPGDWTVLRELAHQNGLDLNLYRGRALFDGRYRHCIDAAILTYSSDRHRTEGRVTSALLEFTLDSPCGVKALEVGYASDGAR